MKADSEFRRGWPVVVAGLVGVACGASPVPYTLIGQLIGPMHSELGWSVGDISLAITLFGLAASFMAPYVGSLTDRIGLRPADLVARREPVVLPPAWTGARRYPSFTAAAAHP